MQNTKIGRAAAHTRRVAGLQKRIDAAAEQKATQEAALGELQTQITALQDQLTKAERYNTRATAEISKLDAEVEALPPEQKAQLKALFDGYTRSESLRDQEARFKDTCKGHMAEMQARLVTLQAELGSGEAAARIAELSALHTAALARLNAGKAVVAAKTREITKLQRLIDEVPSRAELLQYERRFTGAWRGGGWAAAWWRPALPSLCALLRSPAATLPAQSWLPCSCLCRAV